MRIDVAAAGHPPQQRGFNHGRAASHERIVDRLAGLGESFDEEARKLRLETGAIRDLVQTGRLPLPCGPELVHESWHPDRFAREGAALCFQNARLGVELAKAAQLILQGRRERGLFRSERLKVQIKLVGGNWHFDKSTCFPAF